MSLFQCDKCGQWAQDYFHKCVPAPKVYPAWTCGDCGKELTCSISEHQDICGPSVLNPDYALPTVVAGGPLEPHPAGGWRRKPRVRPAFDMKEMPRQFWCWMVERRRLQKGMGVEYWGDWDKARNAPYGFGGKASALRRMMELMTREAHNVAAGIAEFRVTPHYLGYVPVWPKPVEVKC